MCNPGFGSSQEVPSEEVPTAFCPTNLTVPDDLPALPNVRANTRIMIDTVLRHIWARWVKSSLRAV